MVRSRIASFYLAVSVASAVLAGSLAWAGGAGAPPATAPAATERTIEDGGTGKFKAIMASEASIATHTIFRPKDLSAFGTTEKLPILAWGNGGCANSPSGHTNYLSEIASHGFLVVAIGPFPAAGGGGGGRGAGPGGPGGAPGGAPGRGGPGRGAPGAPPAGGAMGPTIGADDLFFVGAPGGAPAGGAAPAAAAPNQMLAAIDWAIAQNKDPQSKYFNKIDVSKIAVFGHSCGGLQALEVSGDPRITTTLVVNSGIVNAGGGGGAPGGPGRGAPGGAPGRGAPGAEGPSIDELLFFTGAPGGAPGAGAPGPGPGRAGGPGAPGAGRAGGAPGGGRAGGGARGGGGGMGGMPPLNKDHLTKLHGSVLYLLGGPGDVAYANGMDDFKRIEKIPVFLADKAVGHGGTFMQPHGSDWAMVSVAWLKWQLKGDAEAGKLFTGNPPGLSKLEGWTFDKKNIP